mmetsp:Transcript_19879/g.30607  ORF Transcript_19879/g.30607 Transcript_19879/m.30607 type:complete len:255 (+) Transcript_19879:106-870(+)
MERIIPLLVVIRVEGYPRFFFGRQVSLIVLRRDLRLRRHLHDFRILRQNPFFIVRQRQGKAFHDVHLSKFSKVGNRRRRGGSVLFQQLLAPGVGSKRHLQFEHRFGTVVQNVLDLAGVDANDAQQEMARDSQCQGDAGVDNRFDGLGNVSGKDLRPGEFFVSPMGRQPDFGEGAFFGQDDLGVKHCGGLLLLLLLLLFLSVQGAFFSRTKSARGMKDAYSTCCNGNRNGKAKYIIWCYQTDGPDEIIILLMRRI